jgi:type IV secretion system pilin
MLKTKTLKIFALLLLVCGFVGLGQPRAAAVAGLPVSQQDAQKIVAFCTKKLPKNSKSSTIDGCAYGYALAIAGKPSSQCDSQFKKDKDADKACKDPGYSSGKSDPLGLKPKGGGGGGAPACAGSTCSPTPSGSGQNCDSNQCDLISLYVNPAVRLLSILVGLVLAASLIMGGVQYSAAGSDPQKVSAAKSRISNTLLALFAYAFLYAFLNFLIPGGVFR